MDEREQRKLVKKQQRREALRQTEIDEALSAIMSHPNGRRAINWVLENAGTNGEPFTGNALTTAFNCGQQRVGKMLQARIASVAPDHFLTMLKEMENERRADLNDAAGDDAPSDDDTTDD